MYSFVNRFPPNLFFDILLFTFYAFRNRQSFSTANARWLILFFVSFPSSAKVLSYPSGIKIGSYPKPEPPRFSLIISPFTMPSNKCFFPFVIKQITVRNCAFLF